MLGNITTSLSLAEHPSPWNTGRRETLWPRSLPHYLHQGLSSPLLAVWAATRVSLSLDVHRVAGGKGEGLTTFCLIGGPTP